VLLSPVAELRLVQRLRVRAGELQLRVLLPSPLDQLRGEIDAHAVCRLQRRKQIARPAADFQNARAGRHAERDQTLDSAVIGRIFSNPALALRREAIKLGCALLPRRFLALLEWALRLVGALHTAPRALASPAGLRRPSSLPAL